ncbi:MAG: biliverdin-producing heme oxygenase [Phaeodactylibacter sp.]|uniref:biliverdin-producing heme oxygenase n=1 Tax=Phaeodactylibacter sp. TaxID=1940289 RepID=UPI0032ED84C3
MDKQRLQNLRAATRPLHDRLESLVDGARLMEPPFDPLHYAKLLKAHLGFTRLINAQFTQDISFEVALPTWPDTARMQDIEADLKALGVSVPEQAPDSLAISSPNAAFVVGLCYVAEGAAMGNQMMHKALLQLPAFRALDAQRYLQSSKDGLSARWKTFQKVLGHYLIEEEPVVIEGAKTGFSQFENIWASLEASSSIKVK